MIDEHERNDAAGLRDVFVVDVRHNLVASIKRESADRNAPPAKTKLEVGTQLAENFQWHGCIDGRYLFANEQRARIFATLCLEFVQALLARRLDDVRKLRAGDEYEPPQPSR